MVVGKPGGGGTRWWCPGHKSPGCASNSRSCSDIAVHLSRTAYEDHLPTGVKTILFSSLQYLPGTDEMRVYVANTCGHTNSSMMAPIGSEAVTAGLDASRGCSAVRSEATNLADIVDGPRKRTKPEMGTTLQSAKDTAPEPPKRSKRTTQGYNYLRREVKVLGKARREAERTMREVKLKLEKNEKEHEEQRGINQKHEAKMKDKAAWEMGVNIFMLDINQRVRVAAGEPDPNQHYPQPAASFPGDF